MPEILHLSQEMAHQIAREAHPERELSQRQIETLASTLNLTLSGQYGNYVELYSEPTFKQLQQQIDTLHKALEKVKRALPPAGQVSLRNYLIHLGEEYAAANGPHPDLEPAFIGGILDFDTGEDVSTLHHYRSDDRLEEMISSVLQVLEWMDHTPAKMKEPSNWWDHYPHWFEGEHERWLERLEKPPLDLPIDAHRRRAAVYLIGDRLPQVYQMTFNSRYGISRSPPGPGIRFVSAVLRHAEIYNDDNKPFSIETIIKYRQIILRDRRKKEKWAASLLYNKARN
jgi:hypothetical protein